MKVVARTDEYTIYLRRDGRHAVTGADKASINGDEKVKILLEQGLITAPAVKAPEPEPEPEAEAEAAADDGAEDAAKDDSSAEASEETSEEGKSEG